MKRMLGIAMGIGFLVSSVFMSIPSMRDGTSDWAGIELPGIGWAVNAVVYGLVALVIIGTLKIIRAAAGKISN